MPHRLAVSREPGRPVRQVALSLHVADCSAAVRASAATMEALAALGREERDHVVARRDERDTRPDALDDPGSLVPENARRVSGRVGAGGGVEIGVTHAARGKAYEHLAFPRLCQIELLDDERLPEVLEHCGADLHGRRLTRSAQSRDRGRVPARR